MPERGRSTRLPVPPLFADGPESLHACGWMATGGSADRISAPGLPQSLLEGPQALDAVAASAALPSEPDRQDDRAPLGASRTAV